MEQNNKITVEQHIQILELSTRLIIARYPALERNPTVEVESTYQAMLQMVAGEKNEKN